MSRAEFEAIWRIEKLFQMVEILLSKLVGCAELAKRIMNDDAKKVTHPHEGSEIQNKTY